MPWNFIYQKFLNVGENLKTPQLPNVGRSVGDTYDHEEDAQGSEEPPSKTYGRRQCLTHLALQL